jgi:hypothetical protein
MQQQFPAQSGHRIRAALRSPHETVTDHEGEPAAGWPDLGASEKEGQSSFRGIPGTRAAPLAGPHFMRTGGMRVRTAKRIHLTRRGTKIRMKGMVSSHMPQMAPLQL